MAQMTAKHRIDRPAAEGRMEKLKPYAKFVAAIATAGLIAAQQALPMPAAAHGWVSVALAVLGAIAVYQIPNTPRQAP